MSKYPCFLPFAFDLRSYLSRSAAHPLNGPSQLDLLWVSVSFAVRVCIMLVWSLIASLIRVIPLRMLDIVNRDSLFVGPLFWSTFLVHFFGECLI